MYHNIYNRYAATASGPKDMILILDTSGSMLSTTNSDVTRLSLMQDAASAVLDTLTSDDYATVIEFNSKLDSKSGMGSTNSRDCELIGSLDHFEFLNNSKYIKNELGEIIGVDYSQFSKKKLDGYFRYRDDIAIVGFFGSRNRFEEQILPKLEKHRLKMKFKVEQAGYKMDYLNASFLLDTESNKIKIMSFAKKTNTHSYVPFGSMHQLVSFKSCIQSLMFMARCLNDDDTFGIVGANYCKFLLNRGYPKELVFETMQPYTEMTKLEALKISKTEANPTIKFTKYKQKQSNLERIFDIAAESPTKEKSLLKPINLVYRHHVRLPSLKAAITIAWLKTIAKDPVISKLFPLKMFVVGYRKDANLKDLISVTRREYEHQRIPSKDAVNLKCNDCNCKLCKFDLMADGLKSFHSTFALCDYEIMHKADCNTTWVIYCIKCKHCGAEYVGSCEQPLKVRTIQHLCRMCKAELECLNKILEDSYIQMNLYEHFKVGCIRKQEGGSDTALDDENGESGLMQKMENNNIDTTDPSLIMEEKDSNLIVRMEAATFGNSNGISIIDSNNNNNNNKNKNKNKSKKDCKGSIKFCWFERFGSVCN